MFDLNLGDSLAVVVQSINDRDSLLYSLLIALVVAVLVQVMDEDQFSQSKKAKAARKWRTTNRLKKRFDGPLKEFVKVKYNDIYDEYVQFYNLLDKKYPNVRDLSKTRMFKKWARRVWEQQAQSDSTQSADENEVSVQVQNQSSSNQSQEERQPDQLSASSQEFLPLDTSLDILSTAIQETLPEGIPHQLSVSLQEFLPEVIPQQNEASPDDIIEEIINDLEQNEAVWALLDPVVDDIINGNNNEINRDDDEGIELNFIVEIEFDLQPFDYNLEVDF